jgi:Bacterial low temperature requirement A protein (LtrA)
VSDCSATWVQQVLLYALATGREPEQRRAILRLAPGFVGGPALLVVAGFLDGSAQGALWAGALAVGYGVAVVRGVSGFRIHAGHFAERNGLVVIIALGESIVAAGVGVSDLIHRVGQPTVHPLDNVAVGVKRDVYARVAQKLLHVLRMLARHEEYRSARVAWIAKPDARWSAALRFFSKIKHYIDRILRYRREVLGQKPSQISRFSCPQRPFRDDEVLG